jgi:hypothetical protein
VDGATEVEKWMNREWCRYHTTVVGDMAGSTCLVPYAPSCQGHGVTYHDKKITLQHSFLFCTLKIMTAEVLIT